MIFAANIGLVIGMALTASGFLTFFTLLFWIRRRTNVVQETEPASAHEGDDWQGSRRQHAHEDALARLVRLGSYGVFEAADNRPVYFSMSEVIREYLGRRFGFDSVELTTGELLDELGSRAAARPFLGEIANWLKDCDLVKFAKVSPSATQAQAALKIAIRMVKSI